MVRPSTKALACEGLDINEELIEVKLVVLLEALLMARLVRIKRPRGKDEVGLLELDLAQILVRSSFKFLGPGVVPVVTYQVVSRALYHGEVWWPDIESPRHGL